MRGIPALMYHHVTPAGSSINVTPGNFDRQMRFLKENGYQTLHTGEFLDVIKGQRQIPKKAVIITFDDGYKDNYTYAFPVLKKYNLPATVFVIINEIERHDRLSWQEIEDMRGSGIITFGSHALGPQPLIDIESEEELRRQIFDSKKIEPVALPFFAAIGGDIDSIAESGQYDIILIPIASQDEIPG